VTCNTLHSHTCNLALLSARVLITAVVLGSHTLSILVAACLSSTTLCALTCLLLGFYTFSTIIGSPLLSLQSQTH